MKTNLYISALFIYFLLTGSIFSAEGRNNDKTRFLAKDYKVLLTSVDIGLNGLSTKYSRDNFVESYINGYNFLLSAYRRPDLDSKEAVDASKAYIQELYTTANIIMLGVFGKNASEIKINRSKVEELALECLAYHYVYLSNMEEFERDLRSLSLVENSIPRMRTAIADSEEEKRKTESSPFFGEDAKMSFPDHRVISRRK